ncbi:MAG: lipocalin family protein, partial [Bacteroidetes bacterium]|nr:lipocalin family protein [Bacteroidota bacterium]
EKHIHSKGFPKNGTNNFLWNVQLTWPLKEKYLIEEVAEDYSYTVVGHPQKKFLYFMCREKSMKEELYQSLVKNYNNKGYDMKQMIKVPQ